jgi:hypothetical protein
MPKSEYIPQSETERELIEVGYDPLEARRYAKELKKAGAKAQEGDVTALGKIAGYYKIIGDEEGAEALVMKQIEIAEETVTFNFITKGVEYEYDWVNQKWRDLSNGRYAIPDKPKWEERDFRYPYE